MIVLGLDPGIERLGYAVLQLEGQNITVLSYGLISTTAQTPKPMRLSQIWHDLITLISRFQPEIMAIESLIFAKNVKTALTISEVRGILQLAAAENNLKLLEFTPLQVKTRLTGYGKADKKQMQNAIRVILSLQETPKPDDVADALAIALCGAYHHTYPI